MDKITLNEEQFKKLVLKEAKKFLLEEKMTQKEKTEEAPKEPKKRITFENVESLIKEIEGVNKSISSIKADNDIVITSESTITKENDKIKRDTDMNEYNKKKNVIHVNETEKDKWNRVLNYKIPSDNER